MQGLESIESAFLRVKSAAQEALSGDEKLKDRTFEDIFALNNEIGKLGRKRPETMAKMKELQSYVNMITVGIKYGRMKELDEGIALAEQSIDSLRERKELSRRP